MCPTAGRCDYERNHDRNRSLIDYYRYHAAKLPAEHALASSDHGIRQCDRSS